MRALLLALATLTLAATSQADFVSWTKRVGTGSQDQAGPLAKDIQGNIYTSSTSDGNLIVTKVEPVNGSLVWTKNLGRARPIDIERSGTQIIVAANYTDPQGRSHAHTYSLAQSDGATRWLVRGIGGPELATSQVYDLDATGSRIILSGAQDGKAVLADVQPYLGSWQYQTWLDGALARSIATDGSYCFVTSEGAGRAWLTGLYQNGASFRRVQISSPGSANALFHNARLYSWEGGQSYLWVGAEMRYGSTSYLFAARDLRYTYGPTYTGVIAVPGGASLLDGVVLHGDQTRLRLAARSFDSRGNPLRREWLFGQGTPGGASEAIIQSPMFVSGYGRSGKTYGHVNLNVRGWDVAFGGITSTAVQAFDGGLNADDELSEHDEDFGHTFITSYRNGRSEARLLSLRSIEATSAQLVGGQSIDISVFTGPAPAGGFTIAARVPANSPVQLGASSIFVPEGADRGVLRVTALGVHDSTDTEITLTCRGDLARTNVRVMPIKLTSLSVTPSSVVGCTNPTGRVTLNGPAPAGGYTVQLSESSTILDTDDQVVVPAGQRWADFVICTFATRVDATPSLTATDRFGSIQRSITVLRPSLSSLRWDLATVRSNTTVCARVRLNAIAPGGGFVVDNSTTGAIRCPGSTQIVANQQEAQIVATTLAVTSPTRSTLTVSLNGRTMSASIVVVP